MSKLMVYILTFCGGIAATLQPSINARLAQKTGVIESACVSFVVGTLVLLLVIFFAGTGTPRGLLDAKWWELTGGRWEPSSSLPLRLPYPASERRRPWCSSSRPSCWWECCWIIIGAFGLKVEAMTLRRLAGAGLLAAGVFLILRR